MKKQETTHLVKSQGEKRTAFVTLFSATMMLMEIGVGLFSKSMALLADGIHMGSHVLVIGLSWGAYALVRHLEEKRRKDVDSDKVLSLAAYTSGVLLLAFALFIMVEAIERLLSPTVSIRYGEAMVVAAIGMVANVICAFALHDTKAHGHEDYNRHSAYLHVLSDALTSVGAIFGLVCAMLWDITWIDALVAIICSLVIARWAKNLLVHTGKALTAHPLASSRD